MKRSLALDFCRVTEAAALAAYDHIGHGDKNSADGAAVKAMRDMLNLVDMDAEIVIGEGEMDEAPMLFIGEKLGCGTDKVDIAVDPIEGTKMCAYGQPNSIATLLAADKGTLLKAPDMYMEKWVVGKKAKGAIDMSKSFEENIKSIAKSLGKKTSELVGVTLNRKRHYDFMDAAKKLGTKVYQIQDGDIVAGMLIHDPNHAIDFMYGIGGAPEAVVIAGFTRVLGGDMEGRLINYSKVWPEDEGIEEIDKVEIKRCKEMNVNIDHIYTMNELVSTDDVVFSATGITNGEVVDGVILQDGMFKTETVLLRGKSTTLRYITGYHDISKKEVKIARK